MKTHAKIEIAMIAPYLVRSVRVNLSVGGRWWVVLRYLHERGDESAEPESLDDDGTEV